MYGQYIPAGGGLSIQILYRDLCGRLVQRRQTVRQDFRKVDMTRFSKGIQPCGNCTILSYGGVSIFFCIGIHVQSQNADKAARIGDNRLNRCGGLHSRVGRELLRYSGLFPRPDRNRLDKKASQHSLLSAGIIQAPLVSVFFSAKSYQLYHLGAGVS